MLEFAHPAINLAAQLKIRMTTPPPQISELLAAWGSGDQRALDELTPLVYEELRWLAHHYMSRERPGHIAPDHGPGQRGVPEPGRSERDALAESRPLLRHRRTTDAADPRRSRKKSRPRQAGRRRAHRAVERGRGAEPGAGADMVALDEALKRLAEIDPRKCRVVELRYFGGVTVEETAEVLKVSPITVKRDWSVAKSWLHREISHGS